MKTWVCCLGEKIHAGVWNFRLKKPWSVQRLIIRRGNMDDNAENRADYGGLAGKVHREEKTLPGLFMSCFGLRIYRSETLLY